MIHQSICSIIILAILFNISYASISSSCPLKQLGEEYEVDKFDGGHTYEDIYCDLFEPIKHLPLVMLEIGFGCGHHVHGASARLWTKYFQKLKYYAIDYYPFDDATLETKIRTCVKEFKVTYPGVVQEVYFGDQSNSTFLEEVIQASNTKFDIIIDDGGHTYEQQRQTFLTLWPQIAPGGLFIVEDLRMTEDVNTKLRHSYKEKNFRHVIQLWIAYISKYGKEQQSLSTYNTTHIDPIYKFPENALNIICGNQICAIRKQY